MAEFLGYMYVSYVVRPVHGQYAHDLIGNTCARFYSCFAACSEHVYSEYFQKSSETIARQGKQATVHTRTRDRARHAVETAEQRQERLTKRR